MKNPTLLILPVIAFVGLLALSLSLKQSRETAKAVNQPVKQEVKVADDLNAGYLSTSEKEILHEINFARKNPQVYVEYAKDLRRSMNGNLIERPGKPSILTREGTTAVDEAIIFLSSVRPVTVLSSSKGLSMAARDHVKNQGPKGTVGHAGSDGSQINDRVDRYGKWISVIGENIGYGSDTPREQVLSMIIDDGVPSRGHRDNLFNPSFRKAGIAEGYHAAYRTMCVIDFAGDYIEK